MLTRYTSDCGVLNGKASRWTDLRTAPKLATPRVVAFPYKKGGSVKPFNAKPLAGKGGLSAMLPGKKR